MASGRVKHQQTQLDEAREDLKGELHKDVSRDFVVAAHHTIIKGLQDELQTCSTAGEVARDVTFVVQSMTNEFQPYELKLLTVNNRVLLESVEKHLELHHPPLNETCC